MGCCLEAHPNWEIAYAVTFFGAMAVDMIELLPYKVFSTVGASVFGLIFLGDIYCRQAKAKQSKSG